MTLTTSSVSTEPSSQKTGTITFNDVIINCDDVIVMSSRISICAEYMDGGSLDGYGAIPEPVLGRIIVGVRIAILSPVCHFNSLSPGCEGVKLPLEPKDHAQR